MLFSSFHFIKPISQYKQKIVWNVLIIRTIIPFVQIFLCLKNKFEQIVLSRVNAD